MKLFSLVILIFGASTHLVYGQLSRTENLILQLSKEKNTYMNADSIDKLQPLLDDRLIFIHSNGMTETKEEMVANLQKGKWEIEKVNWKGQPNVRVFKNNMAILIGKGTFYVKSEGRSLELDLYFTEVYTHYKKGWKLVSRQATKI